MQAETGSFRPRDVRTLAAISGERPTLSNGECDTAGIETLGAATGVEGEISAANVDRRSLTASQRVEAHADRSDLADS